MRQSQSPAGHRPYDEQRLGALDDGCWQLGIWSVVRQILAAGEEPDERTPLPRSRVTNRATQGRVLAFESVDDRTLAYWPSDDDPRFVVEPRERSQVRRQ